LDTFLDRDIIARESEAPKDDACGVLSYVAEHEDLKIP